MTIEEIADKLKKNEIEYDEDYLKAILYEEKVREKDIRYLLLMLWAGEISKREFYKEFKRIANELFTEIEEDMTIELEKRHREGYTEGAFLVQLLKNEFFSIVYNSKYNPKWHMNNGSFVDDLRYYKNRLFDDITKEVERLRALKAPVEVAVSSIEKPFKKLYNSTKAMVDTEMVHAERQGLKAAYQDNDVKKYRYLATLDGLTCVRCAVLDGRVFSLSQAVVGANYPPMHNYCRCTIIPVFSDFDTNQRYAKDENGETIEVTGMTYEEWKKKYPNKVKASTTDMENAQEYRPIETSKDSISEKRGDIEFVARMVENSSYNGDIYISDSVKLKPKQFHTIETSLNDALKTVGGEIGPKCLIISPEEMQTNVVSSYLASKNTLYINSVVADTNKLLELQRDMACHDNPISTYVHELVHWNAAEEYRRTSAITSQGDYLKELRKKCKKKLDDLEQKGYNIFEISPYAKDKYLLGAFDETWTEYMVLQLLGKGG